jgi:hypothetical protein
VRYLLVALRLVSVVALPAGERDVRRRSGSSSTPTKARSDLGGELGKRRFRNCQRVLTFVDGGMTLVDGR